MGILVNIDMPTSCFGCPMARANGDSATCQVTGLTTNAKTKRPEDCPIIFGNIKIMANGRDPMQSYGFSQRISCATCARAGIPEICRYCPSNQEMRYWR